MGELLFTWVSLPCIACKAALEAVTAVLSLSKHSSALCCQ